MRAPAGHTVVRLLDGSGAGGDLFVADDTIRDTTVVYRRGKTYVLEGINQHGEKVFRLQDTDFRLSPEDHLVELP